MQKTMAVYGAAANPPHLGHIDAIEQLLEQVDEVRFMPAAGHAFGKHMLAFEHRLHMAQWLIAERFGGDGSNEARTGDAKRRVIVDDLESRLLQPGQPVYSIQVLRALQQQFPDYQLRLAVGPDNARPEVWAKFRDHETIDRQFGKLVVEQRRPIRSTLIRQQLAEVTPQERLSPTLLLDLKAWLVGQVGVAVTDYILEHNLYLKD